LQPGFQGLTPLAIDLRPCGTQVLELLMFALLMIQTDQGEAG
jgi:hypothetical protein